MDFPKARNSPCGFRTHPAFDFNVLTTGGQKKVRQIRAITEVESFRLVDPLDAERVHRFSEAHFPCRAELDASILRPSAARAITHGLAKAWITATRHPSADLGPTLTTQDAASRCGPHLLNRLWPALCSSPRPPDRLAMLSGLWLSLVRCAQFRQPLVRAWRNGGSFVDVSRAALRGLQSFARLALAFLRERIQRVAILGPTLVVRVAIPARQRLSLTNGTSGHVSATSSILDAAVFRMCASNPSPCTSQSNDSPIFAISVIHSCACAAIHE